MTSSRDMKKHINVKEMMAVLHALRKWLPILKDPNLSYGDNQAVVNGLRNGSIRGPAMKPLRDIAMLLALHDIVIESYWISSRLILWQIYFPAVHGTKLLTTIL